MDYTTIANEIETAKANAVWYRGMWMTQEEYRQLRENERN